MHVRAARARASPVRAQGAVRRMSLLFDAPLIAGLDYREDCHQRGRGAGAARAARRRSTSRRSASTAGSATARRRASAGATISTTRASRRPSRSPTGCSRCAPRRPRFAGVAAERFRPRPPRPLRSRRGHRLAPRPRRVRAGRRHFARHAGDAALPPAHRDRLPPRQPRGRAALGLSAVGRSRATSGSTASSPGDQLRFSITFRTLSDKGRRIAAAQLTERFASRNGCARHACAAADCCCCSRACSKGPAGRPASISARRARSAPNGRWSMSRRAQGKLTATYVETHARAAARAAADRMLRR